MWPVDSVQFARCFETLSSFPNLSQQSKKSNSRCAKCGGLVNASELTVLNPTGEPITVAVGTTIADRPPHRTVRARLRIRLLRRMSGVEASIRIGVQNAGWRNPPVQDWGKTFPPHLGALAAADQNTLPEPAHAKLKDA